MRSGEVNIVIVDDSAVFRKFLVHSLESDSGIKVIGTASNGSDAIELIRKLRPDVVLMDINMPGMDGFETTSQIMSLVPTPVIIISGEYTSSEIAKTFRSLEVGAVDILPKPPGVNHPDSHYEIQKIITHIRLMSEIKVVRRNSISSKSSGKTPGPDMKSVFAIQHSAKDGPPAVIGIGASAGGPMAIQKILLGLNPGFIIPIVIVQHIEPGFAEGFAQWLEMTTGKKVVIAMDGMEIKNSMIILPPGDRHLGFRSQEIFEVSNNTPERGLRPSVNHLLKSIANTFGASSVGIILTGMGTDGAEGLKLMKEKGAVTIAQDKESSMIHGMPGEAIRTGAAGCTFTLDQIITYLNELNHQKEKS